MSTDLVWKEANLMLLVGGRSTVLRTRRELRIVNNSYVSRTFRKIPNHYCLGWLKTTFATGIASPEERENLVPIHRVIEDARIPTQRLKLAAGYDLYSIETLTFPAYSRSHIKTALAIAVPNRTYNRIAPRSDFTTKCILDDAGVIDRDYRGEFKVLLVNHGSRGYAVKTSDRIAHLIVEKIFDQDWEDVEMLDETERA